MILRSYCLDFKFYLEISIDDYIGNWTVKYENKNDTMLVELRRISDKALEMRMNDDKRAATFTINGAKITGSYFPNVIGNYNGDDVITFSDGIRFVKQGIREITYHNKCFKRQVLFKAQEL